jgi:hypothetical protein
MAKTPVEKVYKELFEVEPILLYEKDNGSIATYRMRIVEADTEPKIRLDIRQHITTTRYIGYTARGIAVSLKQVPQLLKGIEKLMKMMEPKTAKKK